MWRRLRRLIFTLAVAALLVPDAGATDGAPHVHTVYAGQRLGSIAKRYHVSVEAICNANGIRATDPIQPGQRLLIPEPDDENGEAARRWRERQSPAPAPTVATARTSRAGTPQTHVVSPGHTLGKIATRYHVSVADLCRANGIEESTPIRPGQVLVIPGRDGTAPRPPSTDSAPPPAPRRERSAAASSPIRHVVASGHTLGKISSRYHVSIDAICTANGIAKATPLRPGQVLLIPGPEDPDGTKTARARTRGVLDPTPARPTTGRASVSSRSGTPSRPSWYAYRKTPWRRGYVTLVGYHETWKGYVIGPDGEVLPAAHVAFCRLMGADGDHPRVDKRLVKLIAKVSDTFGGRSIRVVSGYRTESYALSSRHRRSQALDFSIPGVPNDALRDFVLTFPSVGVGYYPNSSFIHLDVRETKTYWVDLAGPGEAPRYVR